MNIATMKTETDQAAVIARLIKAETGQDVAPMNSGVPGETFLLFGTSSTALAIAAQWVAEAMQAVGRKTTITRQLDPKDDEDGEGFIGLFVAERKS